MLKAGELDRLIELIGAVKPKRMLEIGCHAGKTARACLARIPSLQRYIGIDVEEGYVPALPEQKYERPKFPGHYASHDPRFNLILLKRGSFDITPEIIASIGKMNAVFIDGDHGKEAVAHDTQLARSIVRKGIIVWHDYGNAKAQVKQVLDGSDQPVTHINGTWLAIEYIDAC